MKQTAFGILVCLGLFSGVATANDRGVYLGIGGGLAHSNAANHGFTYDSTTKADRVSLGAKVYGGYSWGTWGVELGQYDFGKYSVAGLIGGTPSEDEYGITAFAVSVVGDSSVSQKLNITGKLGIASARAKFKCISLCAGLPDQSNTSIVPILGVGLKWKVADNLRLRTDLEAVGNASMKFGMNEEKISGALLSVAFEARF